MNNENKNIQSEKEQKIKLENDQFDHIQPIQAKHLEVEVGNNFDRAFKIFRSKVQKEKILSIYKEKQHYEKPGAKKRRKRNERMRKMLELNSPLRRGKKKRANKKALKTSS